VAEAAWVLAGWIAACSAATLGVCGLDKRAALRRGPRVRERTLLLLALAGGSPGLVLGMLAFRHKTRKASFLLRLLAVMVVQAVVLVWAAARELGLLAR
jgi:uncharacterized membrane protein YsdA (DUF1294 family)